MKETRLLLWIALMLFFPILFRPWWLLIASLAIFSMLLWILTPKKSK